MIISDLNYLELITEANYLKGGTNFLQINVAEINQLSIAISYGGPATATTTASISQSNNYFSFGSIRSTSMAISL
jgi:hypothetical protein